MSRAACGYGLCSTCAPHREYYRRLEETNELQAEEIKKLREKNAEVIHLRQQAIKLDEATKIVDNLRLMYGM